MDNISSNDEGLRELALFAGAGGGILGGKLLGWRTVCAVEIGSYPTSVLVARQNDGILSPFPIWDDIRTFNGKPWRGRVDVVSGGFPCQDVSASGTGAGLSGDRSGLWVEMARVIGEARPNKVFVENSPLLTSRGLDSVLWDLAEMGYDARWGTFTAKDEGAQIERERIFIAGTDKEYGKARVGNIKNRTGTIRKSRVRKCPEFWLQTPSNDIGMGNGLAYYMDAVGAIGNGQVPSVVRCAWRILSE